MQNFDSLGKELMNGKNAEKIKELANSVEGQKIGGMIDTKAAERAIKSGDASAIQKILAQVLSTDEGKRFADEISRTIKGR